MDSKNLAGRRRWGMAGALVLLHSAGLLLSAGRVDAQYSENFDSYTAGEYIAGLGGWETWDLVDDDAIDALVTDVEAYSGTNSLAITSTDAADTDIVQPFVGVFECCRWTLRTQVFVPGDATGLGYLILLNTYEAGAGGDKDWSTQVRFDAGLGETVSDGGSGFTMTGTLPLITDEWVEVRVEIDLDENAQSIYYGGVLLAEGVWQFAGKNALECIDLYGSSIAPEFYFDDIEILPDCNFNGTDDAADIADGTSADCDADGRPDECLAAGTVALGPASPAAGSLSQGFGNSMDYADGFLVVGARADDEEGANAGAVYLYPVTPDGLGEVVKIMASDADEGDEFGYSVAMSGEWMIVGSRREDDEASNGGAAYFLRYDSSSSAWVEEQKVAGSSVLSADEFGYSVDIDGARAVIGANLDDDFGSSAGAAYVFRYDGTDWVEEALLQPSGLEAGDQLGRAVSIAGDRVYLAATGDDGVASGAGLVYVYRYDGDEWAVEDTLTASDGGSLDAFGISLSSQCDSVVVGAPVKDTAGGLNAGGAYVYRFVGDEWTEEQLIERDPEEVEAQFGSSVMLAGDLLLIGASDSGDDEGSAHLYRRTTSGWGLVDDFPNPTPDEGDDFGASVLLAEGFICIGAPLANGESTDTGALFTYELRDCNGNSSPDSCDIEDGVSEDSNGNGLPDECEPTTSVGEGCSGSEPPPTAVKFLRGDCDSSGSTSALSDAVFLLRWAFSNGAVPPCMDAADVNGDNSVSALSDAVFLLRYQFSQGAVPPGPGPTTCGVDPDADTAVTCLGTSTACD